MQTGPLFYVWYLFAITQPPSRLQAVDLLVGGELSSLFSVSLCSFIGQRGPHNWWLFPWSWETSLDSPAWISYQTLLLTLADFLSLKMWCSAGPQAGPPMPRRWLGDDWEVGTEKGQTLRAAWRPWDSQNSLLAYVSWPPNIWILWRHGFREEVIKILIMIIIMAKTSLGCILYGRSYLRASQRLAQLIIQPYKVRVRPFTAEETGTQSLSNLPKMTQRATGNNSWSC